MAAAHFTGWVLNELFTAMDACKSLSPVCNSLFSETGDRLINDPTTGGRLDDSLWRLWPSSKKLQYRCPVLQCQLILHPL